MPFISVIVPVYNVEPYLRRCVDSILAQTFSDFELILVDDGSPDNCPVICDEYSEHDNRVHVIHQKNGGLSAARNAGLDWAFKYSDSEWVSFVDSDDWVHSDYLYYLLTGANERKTNLSICNITKTDHFYIDNSNKYFQSETWSPEDVHCNLNLLATIACGKLYRKDLFFDIRYPVGKLHEDKFVTYKLLFACKQVTFVNTILYYYYSNPNGIMNSDWTPRRLDGFLALEEQIVFFNNNHFKQAERHAQEEYTNKLSYMLLKLINENNPKYLPYIKLLKRKLKKAIVNYRAVTDNKKKWVYGLVWPKQMEIYWLLTSLKNRFKGNKNV